MARAVNGGDGVEYALARCPDEQAPYVSALAGDVVGTHQATNPAAAAKEAVSGIAEQFDITQQAVSQHLKVLRDAGLVAVRPQGQRRLYLVRPEGLAGLRDFLAEFWPVSLERLRQAVESGDDD